MSLHVEITADDIARGKPQNASRCPIALALNRATGQGAWMAVGLNAYAVWSGQKVPLPVEAQGFMQTFDAGKPVQPFSFEVEIDDA